MKKAWFMALAIGASSMLAACGGGGSGTSLTGGTWYLTSGSETAPAWQWAVPPGEQSKYTIAFASDGTFSATADCNQVAGVYKASGSDALTILPGPSTMAYCGDGSLGDLYVHSLSTTTNYKIANGELDADARERHHVVHLDEADGERGSCGVGRRGPPGKPR